MNINIDPKKELFKWGPIEFKFIYGSFFLRAIFSPILKQNKMLYWPSSLLLLKNKRMLWITDFDELKKVGVKYFDKYFLNKTKYNQQIKKWLRWIDEYNKYAEKFESYNLKKLNNKELIKAFEFFYDFYLEFWLIVHVPEIANWGGESELKKYLSKIDTNKADVYLEILSASIDYSFFQQEELDLLRIGLIKNVKEKDVALKKHVKKYHWILNSYGGNRILNKKYFKDKLEDLTKEKTVQEQIQEIKNIITNHKKRKERLIKELNLNKKIILIAEQLSYSIWWQDLRKGYIWRMQYYLDKFLKEIAKRTSWKFENLQLCDDRELLSILKNEKINQEEIAKRKDYFIYYLENGKISKSINKELFDKLSKTYSETDHQKDQDLKGLVVSRGKSKIRGAVKIIKNPFKDMKKMNQGDILVASMTSPEFIIAMRKAGAIITDHGGMTCHAAIVSRELKIPCIVATKVATQVLEDNMEVEVDTDSGIVKIIKTKK